MFGINDFYPSVKERLLWETIRFAKSYIFIFSKDIEIIFHARKSFLYYNEELWVKKGDSNIDVTMGAYNGAEVCELIGVLMLLLLSKHINKNSIGLYSNDGLTILKNTSGPEAEKSLKKFHDQLKKDSQFCHHQKIFFRSQPFTMKNV